ncbi:hypothetical protein QZH41_001244 [Actinostola sp. cb2023]|nr:hypothetical protein QZH41_001244 [Actinostola sp. cb2023]
MTGRPFRSCATAPVFNSLAVSTTCRLQRHTYYEYWTDIPWHLSLCPFRNRHTITYYNRVQQLENHILISNFLKITSAFHIVSMRFTTDGGLFRAAYEGAYGSRAAYNHEELVLRKPLRQAVVLRDDFHRERTLSEPSKHENKHCRAQKYARDGPREFVPIDSSQDVTLENIKRACEDYFESRIGPNLTCDVLAGERGPSCKAVDQIPDLKIIHIRAGWMVTIGYECGDGWYHGASHYPMVSDGEIGGLGTLWHIAYITSLYHRAGWMVTIGYEW